MLILSRKLRQQIRIADDIVITVLQVKGSTVRLGIEAPCDVKILRGELDVHSEPRPRQSVAPAVEAVIRNSEVGDGQQRLQRIASDCDGDLSETIGDPLEHRSAKTWESDAYRPSPRPERTAPLRRFMSVC